MPQGQTYTQLALWYDKVMEHVDYVHWARFLKRLFKAHGIAPKNMLELAAGTCLLAPELSIPSVQMVVRTDLSLAMLVQAKSRLEDGAKLVACDATQLCFAPVFDLVLMTYDSVNYIMPQTMARFLRSVHSVLVPGGYFVFDVTTERNSLHWFDGVSEAIEDGEGLMTRQSWYDPVERLQHNKFDWFIPVDSGLFERKEEHHCQKIYEVAQLSRWATDSGFSVVACVGDFTLTDATTKADRVHFVLRKPIEVVP